MVTEKASRRLTRARIVFGIFGILLTAATPLYGAETLRKAPSFTLKNKHIRATFQTTKGVCRLKSLSRTDNSDKLILKNDAFEVLLFDKTRATADQYKTISVKDNATSLTVRLLRRKDASKAIPERIAVTYTLGEGPYLYKEIFLHMKEGDKIDRLQLLRFSSDQKASRGGDNGQPVFIGKWFFGANYPCFYSRHSDDFKQPDFHYVWNYTLDLEGGDQEYAPRDGLVTLFHFPGLAKKQSTGDWGIQSKRAVIGISPNKKDDAEFALLDYIETYRQPSRSYLHFNNWYSPEAKKITVEDFVDNVAIKIKTNLERYGARLDAMVPDDGWHRKTKFKRIYESLYPLDAVNEALRKQDIDLGVWIAMDGSITHIGEGKKVGYRPASPRNVKTASKKAGRWGPQQYFNILDTKYQEDYKEAVRYLLEECDVRYIKHDFNHMYTYNHLTDRHAREACLDVTLELMAYERKLNPKLLINYTNGTFFTPFWLLYAEYVWMNSSDHGSSPNVAQICALEEATTYRDHHFYQSFNNPKRTVRPILPIANFMTHGILHSSQLKYFDPKTDPMHEWLNYVVMYYGRGTLLKELYISPDELTDSMWKALGTATTWAQKNEDLMRNTVLVGGNANKGDVYGFISWQGDKALLTVRNPNRPAKTLTVPFDTSVYYRGENDQPFRARAIYPFVEHMPWKLVSGQSFSFEIPGDSVMSFEITPGKPLTDTLATPKPLPDVVSASLTKETYHMTLEIVLGEL